MENLKKNIQEDMPLKIQESVKKRVLKPRRSMKKLKSMTPNKIKDRKDLFHQAFWK